VSKDNDSEDGLLAMLKRVILTGQDQILPAHLPEAGNIESDPKQFEPETAQEQEPERQPAPLALSTISPITETRQKRSSVEIQDIILNALVAIPDAPKEGMTVTVYGYSPWNAMVTFAPGSATTATAKTIRGLLGRFVERMRDKIQINIPKN
jgi:hypothetical protein